MILMRGYTIWNCRRSAGTDHMDLSLSLSLSLSLFLSLSLSLSLVCSTLLKSGVLISSLMSEGVADQAHKLKGFESARVPAQLGKCTSFVHILPCVWLSLRPAAEYK